THTHSTVLSPSFWVLPRLPLHCSLMSHSSLSTCFSFSLNCSLFHSLSFHLQLPFSLPLSVYFHFPNNVSLSLSLSLVLALLYSAAIAPIPCSHFPAPTYLDTFSL